jgi:hypothetical protein
MVLVCDAWWVQVFAEHGSSYCWAVWGPALVPVMSTLPVTSS